MTQIRVHELASELNASTQQILTILEELGKKVRGPSTVIGVSVAAKVRARYRQPKSVSKDIPMATDQKSDGRRIALTPVVVADDRVVGQDGNAVPASSSPTATSQSLFLPPVPAPPLVAVARSTAAFANPFTLPAPRQTRQSPPPAHAAPAAPHSVVNRVSPISPVPLVAEPEPDYDALWTARGIEKADQELWLAGGLRVSDASLADRCSSAGIAPEELGRKLSGRTALQRLRDGEAITSVWARIREAEQQPRRSGTKLTGRFQLS